MQTYRFKSLFLSLLFATPLCAVAVEPDVGVSGVDWPSFRGAGAKGIADGYPLPVSWNADPEQKHLVLPALCPSDICPPDCAPPKCTVGA